jgi:effector-binding domain-containing protein
MKKGVVISLVIVMLLFITSILPITQDSTIPISATFDNTLPQIMQVKQWRNWYPEINESYKNNPSDYRLEADAGKKNYTINVPGRQFIIHAISPVSYQVSEVGNKWGGSFAFTAFPGDSPGKMNIYLVRKTSLLFTLLHRNEAGERAINGLKSFLENPMSFYGYEIEMSQIRDPIIASLVVRTNRKDIFLKIRDACGDLDKYIKTNDLMKTGPTSISYIPLSGDSIQLTVGFPINKLSVPGKNIKCLSLPAKGRVLVGIYEGKFSERNKIYVAMSKYLENHTLAPPAGPFERYLNDSIPSSESSIVKIELNYPVY